MEPRKTALQRLREDAQGALELLTLDDISEVVGTVDGVSPGQRASLLKQAEDARFRDEVLGGTVMPSHLYMIAAMMQDPRLPGVALDVFLERLRQRLLRRELVAQ